MKDFKKRNRIKLDSISVQSIQEDILKLIISNAKEDFMSSIRDIVGTPDEIILEMREAVNQIYTKYKPEIDEEMGEYSYGKLKRRKSKKLVNSIEVNIPNHIKRLQIIEQEFFQQLGVIEYSEDELLNLYYKISC